MCFFFSLSLSLCFCCLNRGVKWTGDRSLLSTNGRRWKIRGPGVSQPAPETFVPARGVVQMETKGSEFSPYLFTQGASGVGMEKLTRKDNPTKYLQIVTNQSPADSQSLTSQSLLTNPSLTTSKR